MTEALPRVTILLALDDDVGATVRCLESIVSGIEPEIPFEIVIVDDATSDGTAAFLRAASGDVRIVRNALPVGRSRCLNQAARLATAPLLLLLRQEIALAPRCLAPLLDALDQEPLLGAVQPMVVDEEGAAQGGAGERGHPDFVTTSCVAIRAEAFAQVGGFDEAYRLSVDADVHFSSALRKAGWALRYEPASRVIRHARGPAEPRTGEGKGADERLRFTCNVCLASVSTVWGELERERPSCQRCGSTVRMRSIVHVLSTELFGKSLPLSRFPIDKSIRGIGMSDSTVFADILAGKLGYVNTFYHQEPRLDITDVPESMWGTLDFIVTSDVYEHVPSPVSRAFVNARKLLKPGGVFILTVPYSLKEETVEHFADLHDWEVVEKDGRFVLHNRNPDGSLAIYDNLVFHGGPGQTLEMRLFSLAGIRTECLAAGFEPARVRDDASLAYGVYWRQPWSLPIAARRPK